MRPLHVVNPERDPLSPARGALLGTCLGAVILGLLIIGLAIWIHR